MCSSSKRTEIKFVKFLAKTYLSLFSNQITLTMKAEIMTAQRRNLKLMKKIAIVARKRRNEKN